MKTTPIWILALVGAIGLAAKTDPVTAQEPRSLQAGPAAVDITPQQFPIRVRGTLYATKLGDNPLRRLQELGATELSDAALDDPGFLFS